MRMNFDFSPFQGDSGHRPQFGDAKLCRRIKPHRQSGKPRIKWVDGALRRSFDGLRQRPADLPKQRRGPLQNALARMTDCI